MRGGICRFSSDAKRVVAVDVMWFRRFDAAATKACWQRQAKSAGLVNGDLREMPVLFDLFLMYCDVLRRISLYDVCLPQSWVCARLWVGPTNSLAVQKQ